MPQTHKAQINGTLRLADGSQDFGGWQTHAGGRITGEASESRPVGSKYPQKAAAPGSIENITLTRDYESPRDDDAYTRLEALRGTEATFVVGKVIRDPAGNITRVRTRVGILLEVMDGEGDTNGGTDKATLEVVLGING